MGVCVYNRRTRMARVGWKTQRVFRGTFLVVLSHRSVRPTCNKYRANQEHIVLSNL